MTTRRLKQVGLTFAFVAGSTSTTAMAATSNDFVVNAAEGGITEVEAGNLALEKSNSADVKTFAKHMITDQAYANNQVVAHEKTVELFKKEASASDNSELKAFATKPLQTLEAHLKMAKELQAKQTH